MKWILYLSIVLKLMISTVSYAQVTTPWPNISSQINLGNSLKQNQFPLNENRFEGSGAAYDLINNKVYILTTGYLIRMNPDGTLVEQWELGFEDQESLALRYIRGKRNPMIYVGIEYDEKEQAAVIKEFDPDLRNGSYTGKQWSMKGVLSCPQINKCMEGITFIPDRFYSYNGGKSDFGSGGIFVVSTQGYGELKFIDIDLANSNSSAKVYDTVQTSHQDVSDISYDVISKKLYVVLDRENLLQIYNVENKIQLLSVFQLPDFTNGQEGFAIISNCNTEAAHVIFAGDEEGTLRNVWELGGFPIDCSNSFTRKQKSFINKIVRTIESKSNATQAIAPAINWVLDRD